MEDMIIAGLPQSVPFVPYVGIVLTHANSYGAAGYLNRKKEIENHIKSIHAGAIYTLGETVAGAAVIALFFNQIASVKIVVSGAQVSYLKIAKGKINAKSKITSSGTKILENLSSKGKITFSTKVNLFNIDNEIVSSITFDFHVSKITTDQ